MIARSAQQSFSSSSGRSRLRVTPGQAAAPATRGRALLVEHFKLIQQKLLGKCCGLPKHETEELRSWFLFRLVEYDYRILASWEDRSPLSTFLTVVLVKLMRYYRIHVWGKGRPSSEARRQGDEAVLLERLWVRDGLPLDEATHRLRAEHGVTQPLDKLKRIASTLPRRIEGRRIEQDELRRVPVDGQVESRLEDRERSVDALRLREALSYLLHSLPAEDLLLKLYYQERDSAAISPLRGLSQRKLRSLRDRCLKNLRYTLAEAGVGSKQVTPLLGWSI
jgi:hypothetical protein